jgi:hypothetical protein
MVVVDEVRKAAVDALMVRHMRIGRVNAHRLGHDLGERPPALQQLVIDPAAALLVAQQYALFHLLIEASRFGAAIRVGCGGSGHQRRLLGGGRLSKQAPILGAIGRKRQRPAAQA